MDRVAFVFGNTFLYWNSILMVLSAAAAICLFAAFYFHREGSGIAVSVTVPVAMVLSLFFARLIHWYFRPDSYSGFGSAMTDYTSGGYALIGVFIGCLLAAVLVWQLKLEENLGRLLDAMSLGGCGGIAVGRLACFFSTADRGQLLTNFTGLPAAYPVVNAVNGAMEYRFATFLFQSMAAFAIFIGLTVLYFRDKTKKGDLTLLFLLFYTMTQTVLDSTRYDSLYMRSNGFISVVQLLSAITLLAVCAVFSVQLVRSGGFEPWYTAVWAGMAALMGIAGYMEYYVQRHGDKALFSYSIMTLALGGIVGLAVWLYLLMQKKKERRHHHHHHEETWRPFGM